MGKRKIFISYSHKDKTWKDRLVKQLEVLQIHGDLEPWVDTQIHAGADWYDEIEKAIDDSDAAVLLISADFLTSDFILKDEVPGLLKRKTEEGMKIFPLIVAHCPWTEVQWLSAIEARPKDGKPLSELRKPKRDKVLSEFAVEIKNLLNKKKMESEHLPMETGTQPLKKPGIDGAEKEIKKGKTKMASSPGQVLKKAIEAVPAVRYALGVGGIAFIVAIIAGFKIEPEIAIFGPIFVIGLMFLLLVFSNLTRQKKKTLRLPALVLTWAFLILTIFASTLFVTSYFFRWPIEFKNNSNDIKLIKESVLIQGKVTDTAGNPIKGAVIRIPSYQFKVKSKDKGLFSRPLEYPKEPNKLVTVTLKAWCKGYDSYDEDRTITKGVERFEIILKKIEKE